MSIVSNAYITNHNLDYVEIVDLLTIGFSGTLRGWQEKYLTEEFRESIKKAIKKVDDGLPIFHERIGEGILDGVNTIIYGKNWGQNMNIEKFRVKKQFLRKTGVKILFWELLGLKHDFWEFWY